MITLSSPRSREHEDMALRQAARDLLFRHWRPCEDNDLIVGLECGLTVVQIAEDLFRPPAAVAQRLLWLRDRGRLPARFDPPLVLQGDDLIIRR